MLSLLKKEFLIIKKLVYATIAILLLIPILTNFLTPAIPSIAVLLYMVLMGILMLLQTTFTEEEKSPKAASFLCAIGYSRKSIVLSKYVFCFLEYIFCIVVYVAMSFIFDSLEVLNTSIILITLLAGSFVVSMYIPVAIKYGSAIARYIFVTLILLISMGPSLAERLLQNFSFDFSFMKAIPQNTVLFTLLVTILMILSISIVSSIKLYSKKEL